MVVVVVVITMASNSNTRARVIIRLNKVTVVPHRSRAIILPM
jgi:hypothetical protein